MFEKLDELSRRSDLFCIYQLMLKHDAKIVDCYESEDNIFIVTLTTTKRTRITTLVGWRDMHPGNKTTVILKPVKDA